MNKSILIGALLATLGLGAAVASAVEDQGIPDDSLGLSKGSVYDVATPDIVEYKAGDAGSNKRIARSYTTAPPMVPHSTKDFVPITLESNLCKDCHVQPSFVGQKKLPPGTPIPVPASHYVNVKKGVLYMGRWNCTQCHREQADVKLLVNSVFEQKPRRK